jgi:hypothetical protein
MNKTMKRILILSIVVVACCIGCKAILNNILTAPLVKDGYQNEFEYKGKLEKQYAYNGLYSVDSLSVVSNDEAVKRFHVWFPSELKESTKKWPIVVMANGTGVLATRYIPIFEHLASWGFVVVGNQDGSSWFGNSTSTTLDWILAQNTDAESPFFEKIDTEAIGLAGHSQGGVATFYAATQFDNAKYYKAICSMSGNFPDFARSIQAPVFMMGGTNGLDAKVIDGMNECFGGIDSQPVVMGILKDTDHSVVLPRGDAYMTAWFLFYLQGDKQAGKCFYGDDAEILINPAWKEVKRKNFANLE